MNIPELIIGPNGYQSWSLNDKYHRVDGPAVTWANGGQEWYQYGMLHRADGPAVIYADGGQEWWLNNKNYSNRKKNYQLDAKLSDEDMTILLLKYNWV